MASICRYRLCHIKKIYENESHVVAVPEIAGLRTQISPTVKNFPGTLENGNGFSDPIMDTSSIILSFKYENLDFFLLPSNTFCVYAIPFAAPTNGLAESYEIVNVEA